MAVVEGDRLRLRPWRANREGFGGTPTEFVIVRWGARLYLVAEAQMDSFCEAVRSGEEPRRDLHGAFYVRWGDEQAAPPPGLPDIPEPWRSKLPREVVHGVITEKIDREHVRVDLGSSRGVVIGSHLRMPTEYRIPGHAYELVVTSVTADSCVARDECLLMELNVGQSVVLNR